MTRIYIKERFETLLWNLQVLEYLSELLEFYIDLEHEIWGN